jgi:hypothetical protein
MRVRVGAGLSLNAGAPTLLCGGVITSRGAKASMVSGVSVSRSRRSSMGCAASGPASDYCRLGDPVVLALETRAVKDVSPTLAYPSCFTRVRETLSHAGAVQGIPGRDRAHVGDRVLISAVSAKPPERSSSEIRPRASLS